MQIRRAAGEVAHAGRNARSTRGSGSHDGAGYPRRGPDARLGVEAHMVARLRRGLVGLALDGRVAHWIGAWPARRVALAVVTGGLLLSAAVIGRWTPLLAHDGVGIAFDDLSSVPTHTTVDRFHVQVTGLSASATYEVRVSSDRPTGLGFGAGGRPAQTQTVTGAASHTVTFVLFACLVVDGTVRAEVREAGADAAAATVSQALSVLAIPDWVPAEQRLAGATSGPVARAGRHAAGRHQSRHLHLYGDRRGQQDGPDPLAPHGR